MKRIFTLLFAVGMVAVAQAQPGSRGNDQKDQRDINSGYDKGRDIDRNDNPYDKNGRYDNKSISMERKRDMEIAKINREYDFKIQRIQKTFLMSRFEKQRQIRHLQDQRQREIKMVNAKFKASKKRNNDRDDRDYPNNHHY